MIFERNLDINDHGLIRNLYLYFKNDPNGDAPIVVLKLIAAIAKDKDIRLPQSAYTEKDAEGNTLMGDESENNVELRDEDEEVTRKFLWLIRKNTDMVEGRGFMIFDSIWDAPEEEVANWVNAQPGSPSPKSNLKARSWEMKQVEVFTSHEHREESDSGVLKLKAMKKLTSDERFALGLEKEYTLALKKAEVINNREN